MQLTGRSYENGEPICVTVDGDRITAVEPAWPNGPWLDGPMTDCPYIAPGLFDLQINGHGGTWFSQEDLSAEDVIGTLEPHFRYGITRLCPTLITNSFEALAAGFAAIDEACRQEAWVAGMVPGCHMEGPYLSAEDGPRGAHPLQYIRPADWNEFQKLQEISGNRIKLVTLAPECDGAIGFIRKAVESGVVVAIGHTAATGEQILAAVDAGARLSTHLGNGAHGMIRRHPNYIWDQLGEPRLMASIITDGHHLPPAVIRSFLGVKTPLGTILTCDAAGLAGCPPGPYRDGTLDVEILEDGRIVIAGQRQLLAGSGLQTDTCVAHVIDVAGVSLQEAFDMAGRNPARLLGCETIELARGSRADLVLFHYAGPGAPLEILTTIAAGEVRFGKLPD